MKKYLLPLLLFIACNDTDKKEPTEKDKALQVCDFDMKPEQMNRVKREPVSNEVAAGRKPRRPRVPTVTGQPVIYLDFDGHSFSNTSWNYSGTINCSNANLGTVEMQQIFERVVYDFRAFNVLVTTNEADYNNAPSNRRMRVVLTTSHEWYGLAGGVAYTNSFGWGDDTPCFVFTAALNFNPHAIACASSHEPGHTLGLNHCADVSKVNGVCTVLAYYTKGNADSCDVMGVGYSSAKGYWGTAATRSDCSIQNEPAIISQYIALK